MRPEDATAFTSRCFRGEPASCSYACPFHLDVRSLLDKVSKGRWNAAYKVLRNATVFPTVVAALCDEPCRLHCQRTVLGDEPIALRDIEGAILRNAKDRRPEAYVIPPKEQSIAVVGAGLAGLSCALNLAQKKYRVTVFDTRGAWGGDLRLHPLFAEFEDDIALQFSVVEVDFRFDTEVTSLDALADFDAVYVATGADGRSFGLLESWDACLLTTSEPGVFMGGGLVGAGPMESIAQGVRASRIIEGFLQTGRAAGTAADYDREACGHYLEHRGVASVPRVQAASPEEGYTAEEAKAEAARCLQCDCDECLAACEMLRRFRKDPRRVAVEVHSDMAVSPFSSRTVTRETYSCNLCGHCKSVCPEGVDMGALLRFSRSARMSAGVAPAALHDFWLREMDFATTEGSFASAPRDKDTCEYLFYPGCQLGAANPEHVLRTYELLAAAYDLGVYLGCCGAPAYWAGDDARHAADLAEIRTTWERLGRPTMVFACATCSMLFGAFLPEIPRVSVYELLATCADLAPMTPFAQAAVFDPCAARDDTGMEAAVRGLARSAGATLEELQDKNRCCGHGGHIRLANPALYDEITHNRAASSDLPYLVYCANCREVFAARGKPCAHILDVVLGLEAGGPIPTLAQKRDNSIRVKRELMKQTQGAEFEPQRNEWDGLDLVISDDVQQEMDQKLISASDVRETIWAAERSGDVFCDAGTDVRLASMIKPVLTYWVEYRQTAPNTYEVLSAYYHRMRIEREEQ